MSILLSESVVKLFVWSGSYFVIFFFFFLVFVLFVFCVFVVSVFVFCFFIRIASSSNQRITKEIVKVNIFLETFLPYSFHWQLIRE